MINLLTIEKEELEQHISSWGYPKYRADQILKWVRSGVTEIDDMTNLPKELREHLMQYTRTGALELHTELISKDGTRKRAYRLWDGQLIESVLMPYDDGRYTACISSQAGCAMGCVFCATGQMGFARQLTPEEIFEQVARFDSELAARDERLSNIVFMGMGEPLANYRNVVKAVNRITSDLGIGARKITISTVGVAPNIRKLMVDEEMPQVRLAVSLHSATDEERTKLLPANGRYGGLDELMMALKEYIETTNRRITLEWALIQDQNDNPETARQLGNLVKRFNIRRDMIHVNVIPLNPTGGFGGSPSGRAQVNEFCKILEQDFGIACTPRVRRGIDIDAGCGQLKAKLQRKEERADPEDIEKSFEKEQLELTDFMQVRSNAAPLFGVYGDDAEDSQAAKSSQENPIVEFAIDAEAIDFESDDYEDPEFSTEWELQEAQRLINIVLASLEKPPIRNMDQLSKTTSIVDEDSLHDAKRRRKKLLKNLKAIENLRKREREGLELNEEQQAKIAREGEWKSELESVEHNLK
jgi:23S rRNA (adenine2503-C2)-methyltransferase